MQLAGRFLVVGAEHEPRACFCRWGKHRSRSAGIVIPADARGRSMTELPLRGISMRRGSGFLFLVADLDQYFRDDAPSDDCSVQSRADF